MAKASPGAIALASERMLFALSVVLSMGCMNMPNVIDHSKYAGIASMNERGDLTLQMFDAPKGADTQIVKREAPYYKEQLELIGDIAPGERKLIPRSYGQVHMNSDRSIDYVLIAYLNPGSSGRVVGSSRPGDANYLSLLKKVNGLVPGQTKLILDQGKTED